MSKETSVSYVMSTSGEKAEQILRKVFEAAGIAPEEGVLSKVKATPAGHLLHGEFSLASKEEVEAFVKKAWEMSEENGYTLTTAPTAAFKP